jgi:hypothetical protein
MKKVILGVLAVLALVIILGVGLLAATGTLSNFLVNVHNLFSPPPDRAQVFSTQTIVTGIQPMGQLVSVSAQLAKADIFVGVQQGALNACGFSAKHVAQGTVEAGIDLTQISEADIAFDEASKTYTITLPAAQLTSCRIDFIRQYERSTTTCNVDWDAARLLANYEALKGFQSDAVDGGITQRAEQQAKLTLGNFITLLYKEIQGQDVKVVFKFDSSKSSPLPASCQPDAPDGWKYDDASQSWVKQ